MSALRTAFALALVLALAAPVAAKPGTGKKASPHLTRAQQLLSVVPLIDGHNDLPWQYRKRVKNQLGAIDIGGHTHAMSPPMHTDISRLREGQVGGQFWSVYVPVELGTDEAVTVTLEQIDVVYRLLDRYPDDLELALTADDIERIFASGKVASLIGMEGGHSIGNSLGALRMMYALGARYMTLTHWKANDWADSATDEPRHDGLSDFGREVVREMNRLGMIVDLSHVSAATMHDTLDIAAAPVIFSHSSAFAVCDHPRNVPDDVLKRVRDNKGVVMVTFVRGFVSCKVRDYWALSSAAHARYEALYPGDPPRAKAEYEAWKKKHPSPRVTLKQVADHIDHIKKTIGVDYIGIGSDFDGISTAPTNLEHVGHYPALFAELLRRGYTGEEVKQIAGKNVLRVIRDVEAASARLMKEREPGEAWFGEPAPDKASTGG